MWRGLSAKCEEFYVLQFVQNANFLTDDSGNFVHHCCNRVCLLLLLLLFVYIHCLVIQADSAVQLSVAIQ